MEWTQAQAKYGDIIRVKVSFYYHYGIFVDEDTVVQFGLSDNVNRKAEEVFVCTSDIYTFLSGGELEVAKLSVKERAERKSPKETVKEALSRVGEGGYDILHNNCEHFVNSCVFGKKQSHFLDSVRENIRKKLNK